MAPALLEIDPQLPRDSATTHRPVGPPELNVEQACSAFSLSTKSTGLRAATASSFDVAALAATQLLFVDPFAGYILPGSPFDMNVVAADASAGHG
jgi:hypothetical protein